MTVDLITDFIFFYPFLFPTGPVLLGVAFIFPSGPALSVYIYTAVMVILRATVLIQQLPV